MRAEEGEGERGEIRRAKGSERAEEGEGERELERGGRDYRQTDWQAGWQIDERVEVSQRFALKGGDKVDVNERFSKGNIKESDN